MMEEREKGSEDPGHIEVAKDRPAADAGDVSSEGDEGKDNAEATPRITEQDSSSQTQAEAPDDDVGVRDGDDE